MARKASSKTDSTAHLGFEAKLWLAADSQSGAQTAEGNRSNNMDASESVRNRDRQPQTTCGLVHQFGTPPKPLSATFTKQMEPMVASLIDRIILNRTQSRTLATLRDTLLPKLLSGEIAVALPS